MSLITDDYMYEMLRTVKPCTVVILRRTRKRDEPGADQIVWEQGRRNFELRRDGMLCIACPAVGDESDVTGFYIFSTDVETTKKIMDEDPTVKAGIFAYEIHLVDSFPGVALKK